MAEISQKMRDKAKAQVAANQQKLKAWASRDASNKEAAAASKKANSGAAKPPMSAFPDSFKYKGHTYWMTHSMAVSNKTKEWCMEYRNEDERTDDRIWRSVSGKVSED